jgi:endonuclease/exonuclease/phosphatase family metal-dependent hydrolase
MTWNVWWRFGPRWRDRQAGLLATIRGVDADVVALQESWRTPSASQAGELGRALGLHHAFAAPSLPPAPDPPEQPDQAGVEVGIGLLSRWPIATVRPEPLPARHRAEAPVALVATLAHPAGPLPVVATCLEWEPAYGDDRVAQARALAELATDPRLDGTAPVIIDHVLFRAGRPGQRVAVTAARLAGEPVDGLDPSDHLAVVCDLAWANRR